MKATGQLKFTKHPNGSITHEWTGGRRIAVTSALVESLTYRRPQIGMVFDVGSVQLRLVALAPTCEYQGYQDSYIAMREGRLARFLETYWRWLFNHGPSLFRWECKWLRRCSPVEGGTYPKWSLVGILARPLI